MKLVCDTWKLQLHKLDKSKGKSVAAGCQPSGSGSAQAVALPLAEAGLTAPRY